MSQTTYSNYDAVLCKVRVLASNGLWLESSLLLAFVMGIQPLVSNLVLDDMYEFAEKDGSVTSLGSPFQLTQVYRHLYSMSARKTHWHFLLLASHRSGPGQRSIARTSSLGPAARALPPC